MDRSSRSNCSLTFIALYFICYISSSICSTAYVPCYRSRPFYKVSSVHFQFTLKSKSDDNKAGQNTSEGNDNPSVDLNFRIELTARNEEIQVELLRNRLEQANIVDFLKRKPKKLPYNDACRWIQGNLGADTKEEFYDLVENGNLRTPYIPKRPEEYYTQTREWISWEHFLTGIFDQERPSAVRPSTGIFD